MQRKWIVIKEDVDRHVLKQSVHELIPDPPHMHQSNAVWISVHGRAMKIFKDEYDAVNEQAVENLKIIFEKSQQDSKTSAIFVSSVNSLKNKNMKKKETTVAAVSNLTKTEMSVMEAIFSSPTKGKAKKSTDETMVGVAADLDTVDKALDGVDAAKVCRKLKRQGLLTYEWNADAEGNRLEDKSRSVAITQQGFDLIQLGVKVPKPKAEKAPKEDKPKATKKGAVPETEADEEDLLGEDPAEKEDVNQPEGFSVKGNAVTKVVIVRLPEHGRFIKKATNLAEYKELQKETYDGWITRLEDGELTAQED